MRVTEVGTHRWEDRIESRLDPEGRDYHGVAGTSTDPQEDEGTDYGAVQRSFVSVSPVRLDLTARDLLPQVAQYLPALGGQAGGETEV